MAKVTQDPASVAQRMGVSGLYLFALAAYSATSLANLGLVLMLLGALFQWRSIWEVLKRDRLSMVLALLAAYIMLRGFQSAREFPWTASAQWDAVIGWLRNLLFVVAAWWFAADTRRVLTALGLALLGLSIKVVIATDPTLWPQLLAGRRYAFGFTSVGFGLYGGVALLGLGAFAGRIKGATPQQARSRWPWMLLWLIALLAFGELVIINQSRSAWYPLLLLLPITLFLTMKRARPAGRSRGMSAPALLAALMLALAMGGSLYALNATTIAKRTGDESGVLHRLATLDFTTADIPYTSVGIRAHMIHFGLKRLEEHPLRGWGPGTNVLRLFPPAHYSDAQQRAEASQLKIHAHLHNTYLEIAVRLGLLGALIIGVAITLFWLHIAAGRRAGTIPPDVLIMGVTVALFSAAWSLTDFRIIHMDFGHMMILLGGALYTYYLPGLTPLAQARAAAESP